MTLDSINAADPTKPTVKPVPYVGVQFVAIPEFQGLGTTVGQLFSAALAGQMTVDDALGAGADRDRREMKAPATSSSASRHPDRPARPGGPFRLSHRRPQEAHDGYSTDADLARCMMAPSVIVLLVWMIVPLAMTLWFSFQHYNLLNPTDGFAGLQLRYFLPTRPSSAI